jgi:hypothetical protein
VRPVYPAPGFEVDVVVLGFGLLALIGGIGAASVGLAYRQAPGRARQRVRTHASRGSSLVRVAASSGAPVSAVAGVRFAVEPGHGRTAVPVRSAISGAILAVLIVAASLTFGSGLDTLVSRPAAGAVAALGLTLTASVRRRRRDLALLKALGFTRRQLAACVAWQTTVAATIGVIAGIPLGIALGRWLWILFAHQIYAVPRPTVPALPLVCIGLGALVLANAAAALPGRYAARTPAALVLRTE